MKRPELTIAEHQALGAELETFDRTISTVLKTIQNRRGCTCRMLDRLLRMDRELHRLRVDLEESMYRAHSRQSMASTSTYFPGSEAVR
jgi:hypothetical protein